MAGLLLLDLHRVSAWVVVAANAGTGLWALAAHWRPGLRGRALWWSTVVAQVLVFAEVAVGVALIAGEGLTAPDMHVFYGFLAIVAVGILSAYRQQVEAWRYLLSGFGGLFVAGLVARAVSLA